MKRIYRSLGVTLLEVMLMMAIATAVMLTSVKFYRNAIAAQQATDVTQQILHITTLANNLAASSGSYTKAGLSTATIQTLMPNQSMTSPWGNTITITGITATYYKVTFTKMPAAICPIVTARLSGDTHYSLITCTTASFSYRYTAS